jgi:hypothetical protein
MVKKQPSPTPGVQPTGSGAVPGTAAQSGEEYTGPGAAWHTEAAAPGVNDGTASEEAMQKADDAELKDQPGDNELEAEEPMVFYIGEFGRREITVAEWQQANVKDMPQVVWDRQNKFAVPQADFSDRALAVLRQDPGFRFA